MSLPIIGWKEVLKALKKQGFYATRQSGSHIIIENGQEYPFQEKMNLAKDCYYKLSLIAV